MRLTLTPLSGDVAMYVSATEHRPNATRHTWAATEGTAGGALSLTIAYDDASLATCVRYAPQCVLYLSVVGVAPSTFTVVSLLEVLNTGLQAQQPVGKARSAPSEGAPPHPPPRWTV